MEEFLNKNLFFKRSISMNCSYLKNKIEKRLYINLDNSNNSNYLVSDLTKNGFRRSFDHMYVPICDNCSACISTRIDIKKFKLSKSNKRIIKKNSDLILSEKKKSEEQRFKLFKRYCNTRHNESPMTNMSKSDFLKFFYYSKNKTKIFDLIDKEEKLYGSILLDLLDDGYSAVYSFFEPDTVNRSLGKYLILSIIDELKYLKLPYLYIGYWVKHSKKMDYKASFNNVEFFFKGKWVKSIFQN